MDSAVNKVFSDEDAMLIQNASPEERPLVFTKCWTRFEAALKLMGIGFSQFGKINSEVCGGIFFRTEILSGYVITCAAYERFDFNITEIFL